MKWTKLNFWIQSWRFQNTESGTSHKRCLCVYLFIRLTPYNKTRVQTQCLASLYDNGIDARPCVSPYSKLPRTEARPCASAKFIISLYKLYTL